MTTVMKKRVRILSLGSDATVGNCTPWYSAHDDVSQGNPKTHENGKDGGERRYLGDNKVDDSENALNYNTCFVCEGKDNWVLVCHAEECPLAIHQSCASDEPDFDEFGKFYCPYCWYKRVVAKFKKLRTKLMVTDKFSKGRESRDPLGRVDLGIMMDEVTENVGNVLELNVSGDRSITSVNRSGNNREGDESYKKFMMMEKNQQLKEVAAEYHSREVFKTDDADVDERIEQRGRYSEKNHKASDACTSNAGGERKGRGRFSEKYHEKVQVRNSDAGEERKHLRRCNINNEIVQVYSFDTVVKTRKQRFYCQKSQRIKRVAKTQRRGLILINDEGTQVFDSDLGEGRSEQGFFNENNQQKKTSSTESCAHEVPRTDKRLSLGSELGEGSCLQGRHIEKNQHNKKVESETQEKDVSKDGERKLEGAVKRDGDEFYFVENRCLFQAEQENGFRKNEQVERNSVLLSISSPMSIHNVNDINAASQELALIIHPKAGLQAQPIEARPIKARPYCSVCSKNPSFQPEKYRHESYLEKNVAASNDPGQSKKIYKRIFWTQAEEEMLRAGVQKFLGSRNIPWRKILEYGRAVFHEERLPSDLKDKWKKMNKMLFDTGKWASQRNDKQIILFLNEKIK